MTVTVKFLDNNINVVSLFETGSNYNFSFLDQEESFFIDYKVVSSGKILAQDDGNSNITLYGESEIQVNV